MPTHDAALLRHDGTVVPRPVFGGIIIARDGQGFARCTGKPPLAADRAPLLLAAIDVGGRPDLRPEPDPGTYHPATLAANVFG
ncbi:MAG: hypothetical protein V3T12_08925 [Acidiferrobacterales bacterium]